MIFFLLSSFLLHLIVCVCTISEECNPIECFQAFDTLFQTSNVETSCEKVTNLDECIKLCSGNDTDHYFHKGMAEVKQHLCRNDRHDLENKCENKHKFSFATCIYEKFNLEAAEPDSKQNVLMCRQALDGVYCYEDSLPMCSDREGYLSTVLLKNLFYPMKISNCRNVTIGDATDFKLKPLSYLKDLQSLAECLDMNSLHLTDCVHKKCIDTNSMLEGKNLCSDAHSFFNCVQKVVESKCNDSQQAFFQSIRQPVFAYLLPHCSRKQDISSPLQSPDNSLDPDSLEDASAVSDVHGLDNVNSDASTTAISPTNASEVVVVHQHVIITMTYKKKNAASQMHLCFHLFVIVFLLCCRKEL